MELLLIFFMCSYDRTKNRVDPLFISPHSQAVCLLSFHFWIYCHLPCCHATCSSIVPYTERAYLFASSSIHRTCFSCTIHNVSWTLVAFRSFKCVESTILPFNMFIMFQFIGMSLNDGTPRTNGLLLFSCRIQFLGKQFLCVFVFFSSVIIVLYVKFIVGADAQYGENQA